jgi:hypothetical protein
MQRQFTIISQTETIPLSVAEIQFYAAILVVSALAGAFRSFRDSDYKSIGSFLGLCGCSGFLGFACVALLCGVNGAASGRELYYLGIASVVGLLGKEQDQLIRFLVKSAFAKIGISEKEKP